MIKSFLCGVAVLVFGSTVFAQGSDLFPELQGQFESPKNNQPIEKKILEVEMEGEISPSPVAEQKDVPSFSNSSLNNQSSGFADPFAQQNQAKEAQEESGEGNIKITLTNLKGVLPYARDYAYCFGDLVLENDTNQKLEALSLELTYRETPTIVSFGSVDKKKTQTQALMLIGRACEDILSVPQVDVKVCKMPPQSEDMCKKRVQFIPPNS